jgi:hypothetical protein
MLAKAGGEHNLDVDLLASLVKAESGGNARAVSRTGARGLMQLMPGNRRRTRRRRQLSSRSRMSAAARPISTRCSPAITTTGPRAGRLQRRPAAVDKYHGIPPYHETQAYVARVIHEFNRRVQSSQIRE